MEKTHKALAWFYGVSEKEARKLCNKHPEKTIKYVLHTYTNRPKHIPRYS